MQAVISVTGKDNIGIVAKTSNICAEYNVNIADVSQTVMSDMFTMIMMIDISNVSVKFGDFASLMHEYGKSIGMEIRVMHEDIFNSMHRIQVTQ